jgi:hypothetical protein
MESRLRQKLGQLPASKLFIKMFLDLSSGQFYQFKNSYLGWIMTLNCHIGRFLHNRRIVECNICGWQGNRFYPHVTKARPVPDEKCPKCHSIPRYRILQYFLINELDFYSKKLSVLEVGPNRSLQTVLQKNVNFNYVSVDLNSPQAMYQMDVTDLKFAGNKFDFIFCISVMQFVRDDLQGFKEMFRVLKPGGRLLFASGVDENSPRTIIYDPPSAKNSFAVRIYGRDIVQLMQKAGFIVHKFNPAESIAPEQIARYGMGMNSIYLLDKK